MSIFDFVEEEKKERTLNDKLIDRATRIYKKQKGAILDIKDTEGMAEIVRWFRAEKETCESMFASNKGTEATQGEYGLVCRFLTFLENMYDTKERESLQDHLDKLEKELVEPIESSE